MIITKCPYCENGNIIEKKKTINGKSVKLFTCSNYKVYSEDGELWEPTADSTCSYKLWSNSLKKYGKKFIARKEVKQLLDEGQLVVELKAAVSRNVYHKYLVPNLEYGATILWDQEVEDED